MRRALIGGGFSLLPGLILVLAAGPLCAADKKAEAEPPKYKATVHKDHKEQEKEFDLAKEDHIKELTGLLKEGHVEHLEKKKDVSVLDLAWDVGLWTVVVFLLLFFILKKWAWGPILEGLHKREESIRSAVEEAKEARKETERLRAQFQKEMDEAFAKIPQMMDEARRDATRLHEEMRAKAAAETQADRQRLRREIEMAKDQALQDIWKSAAQLATLVSAKAIRKNISEDDHRRLVDEALDELRSAGRG